MQIFGHLSVAWYLTRRRDASAARAAAIFAGTLLPDLIDKSLLYLGQTPYGRSVGHAPLSWAVITLLCGAWRQLSGRGLRRVIQLTLLGAWAHLLTDLCNDAVRGYLMTGYLLDGWIAWPWLNSDGYYLITTPLLWLCRECLSPLELGVIAWALWDLIAVARSRWGWGKKASFGDHA